MDAPLVPLGDSQDGRPGKVQLYAGVPEDAVQVAEYAAPATIELLTATQLTFNFEMTVIVRVCDAVCALIEAPLSETVTPTL